MPHAINKIAVYVDGESHYRRSLVQWQQCHGKEVTLDSIQPKNGGEILVIDQAKVFWSRCFSPAATRTHYFTTVNSANDEAHKQQVRMSNFGLTPVVYPEPKDRREKRNQLYTQHAVIEKGKMVDISLALRITRDSRLDNFEEFHLYTSDVDFVPAIREVKDQGKIVRVFGFRHGMAEFSELEHAPDQFVDLSTIFNEEFGKKNQ